MNSLREEIVEIFEEAQHLGARGSKLSMMYEGHDQSFSVYVLSPPKSTSRLPMPTRARSAPIEPIPVLKIVSCDICGRPREWRTGCRFPTACTHGRSNTARALEAKREKKRAMQKRKRSLESVRRLFGQIS